MADEADRADTAIETHLADSLAKARITPFGIRKPIGKCIWCGDEVGEGRLHCAPADNDCYEVHCQHLIFTRGRQNG